MSVAVEDARLLAGRNHYDPHRVLGRHPEGARTVVRTWRPGAEAAEVLPAAGAPVAMAAVDPAGLFEAELDGELGPYLVRVRFPGGGELTYADPYAFPPTLGELDLHLLGEGRHEELDRSLGAHVREVEGVAGTAFAVWAPAARSVSVVGDFNGWDGRRAPDAQPGLVGCLGAVRARRGPGRALQVRDPARRRGPRPARRPDRLRGRDAAEDGLGRVAVSAHAWGDAEWMRAPRRRAAVARADLDLRGAPAARGGSTRSRATGR